MSLTDFMVHFSRGDRSKKKNHVVIETFKKNLLSLSLSPLSGNSFKTKKVQNRTYGGRGKDLHTIWRNYFCDILSRLTPTTMTTEDDGTNLNRLDTVGVLVVHVKRTRILVSEEYWMLLVSTIQPDRNETKRVGSFFLIILLSFGCFTGYTRCYKYLTVGKWVDVTKVRRTGNKTSYFC